MRTVFIVLLLVPGLYASDFIDGLLDDDEGSGGLGLADDVEEMAADMKKESLAETQLISMLAHNSIECDGCSVYEMKKKLSDYANRRRYFEQW
jgi:hypothetical protein